MNINWREENMKSTQKLVRHQDTIAISCCWQLVAVAILRLKRTTVFLSSLCLSACVAQWDKRRWHDSMASSLFTPYLVRLLFFVKSMTSWNILSWLFFLVYPKRKWEYTYDRFQQKSKLSASDDPLEELFRFKQMMHIMMHWRTHLL